ncbi:hypothetical protein CL629_00830 [bacterium]|nr:hypothetical protein [bacterium]
MCAACLLIAVGVIVLVNLRGETGGMFTAAWPYAVAFVLFAAELGALMKTPLERRERKGAHPPSWG